MQTDRTDSPIDPEIIQATGGGQYGCPPIIFKFCQENRNRGDFQIYCTQINTLGFLYNIDGRSSTLHQDVGSIGYLPNGEPFRFHNYNLVPFSMVRKSLYDKYIDGKVLPWTNHTFLRFSSASIVQYDQDRTLPYSPICGDNIGDFCKFTKVHALGVLPFILGGIPLLVQVLIVDDIFPNQPPSVNAQRFDAIFHDSIFWQLQKSKSYLFNNYDWRTKTFVLERPVNTRAILNITDTNGGNRVLNVWVDGCCLNNGSTSPTGARGGIGVFHAPHSVFNIAVPISNKALDTSGQLSVITNQRAELYAAIEALKQILALRYFNAYIFFSARLFSDSEYLVNGLTEYLPTWKSRGWTNSAGKPLANKDLWIVLDDLLTNYFNAKTVGGNYARHRLELNPIWISRDQNVEADKLAKIGAAGGITALSLERESLRLDKPDGGVSLEESGIGCNGGREQLRAILVPIEHAGLRTLGIPKGFVLKCNPWESCRNAIERCF